MAVLVSDSKEETQRQASLLAGLLHAGDVVNLSGDLGAGKTAFIQGLAKGLGIKERVTSPTFTLLKVYPGPLPLYHFDVYRLQRSRQLIELGYEEYVYGSGVTVIEWGDRVLELLPDERLDIEVRWAQPVSENKRLLEIIPRGERWKAAVAEWLDLIEESR